MLNYDNGSKSNKNWIIKETCFDQNVLGKMEAISYLGNGYMGVRSSTEESYSEERRGMFVSGTFNKFDENEVTELPNMPDFIRMEISIDGEKLDLSRQEIRTYERTLNLKTGLLNRKVNIITKNNKAVALEFKRFVSLEDLHLIGQEITIESDCELEIRIKSGINNQITNSGVQHFSEGKKRLYEDTIMQALFKTTQSKIDVICTTAHSVVCTSEVSSLICMERRKIYMDYQIQLGNNDKLKVTKLSKIYTSRDREFDCFSLDQLRDVAKNSVKRDLFLGFDELFDVSEKKWKRIWDERSIDVDSNNDFDQLAIRFAIYHLTVMAPAHDNRMNIGAKALSGEGYKGHTFWDTEMFLLPSFVWHAPKVARSLLEYRYNCLDGSRRKAQEYGYEGAMIPWESAWITDGEVTPKFGAADVVTGKELPVLTGFKEIHITSDIAYAVWNYYMSTDDQDFMERFGYELTFETAEFWQSRLEWNASNQQYEITDVIGPDEYSEIVSNNAFTNYMAHFSVDLAITYFEEISKNRIEVFDKLNNKLNLKDKYKRWTDKLSKIYLPEVNENNILPQDDTYLSLPTIDITKYKESENVAEIIKDYNMEQLSSLQVSKQADVLVLFYIRESLFDKNVKKANFYYYEDKCLHDSSLSLSTHSVLASDLDERDLAYKLFEQACNIDLGPSPHRSDSGIHAASLGGMWQCAINGFLGVRRISNRLRIEPKLPENWNEITTKLYFRGEQLRVTANKEKLIIQNVSGSKEVEIIHKDKVYKVLENVSIELNSL